MLLALAVAGLLFLEPPLSVVLVAIAAVIEIGEVYFWIHFLRRYRITTGVEGMIGEHGEVIKSLEPDGQVRIRGEIWRARSGRPAASGERVRVEAVDGLTLLVEPERRAGR